MHKILSLITSATILLITNNAFAAHTHDETIYICDSSKNKQKIEDIRFQYISHEDNKQGLLDYSKLKQSTFTNGCIELQVTASHKNDSRVSGEFKKEIHTEGESRPNNNLKGYPGKLHWMVKSDMYIDGSKVVNPVVIGQGSQKVYIGNNYWFGSKFSPNLRVIENERGSKLLTEDGSVYSITGEVNDKDKKPTFFITRYKNADVEVDSLGKGSGETKHTSFNEFHIDRGDKTISVSNLTDFGDTTVSILKNGKLKNLDAIPKSHYIVYKFDETTPNKESGINFTIHFFDENDLTEKTCEVENLYKSYYYNNVGVPVGEVVVVNNASTNKNTGKYSVRCLNSNDFEIRGHRNHHDTIFIHRAEDAL